MVVTEVAQSVDLARGDRFLTVTVELSGLEPAALRRLHPRRDDFMLLAGKGTLPCRWLRGGSVPEDARRLRFTLGFSRPAEGVSRVRLQARLPRDPGADTRELQLTGLRPGSTPQMHRGKGWSLTTTLIAERAYDAPELPAKGVLQSKGGPRDVRVFRKEREGADPKQALVVHFQTDDVGLYDPVVDVDAVLLSRGGPAQPLLAARLVREPARGAASPGAVVRGELYFAVPPGTPTAVTLRLSVRPGPGAEVTLTSPEVPVP